MCLLSLTLLLISFVNGLHTVLDRHYTYIECVLEHVWQKGCHTWNFRFSAILLCNFMSDRLSEFLAGNLVTSCDEFAPLQDVGTCFCSHGTVRMSMVSKRDGSLQDCS